MSNTSAQHLAQTIFQIQPNSAKNYNPTGSVWQDKHARTRMDGAVDEPSDFPTVANGRKHQENSRRHGSNKRKTVEVWGCVNRYAAAEIDRLRKQWGTGGKTLSRSAVVAKIVEQGVQKHVDMQYGTLLEPVIKELFRSEMQPMLSLLRWLLVRVAFDGNQTRSLVANMFSRQPGITREVREHILKETAAAAKANIFGKSPQLEELVQTLDAIMKDKYECRQAAKGSR